MHTEHQTMHEPDIFKPQTGFMEAEVHFFNSVPMPTVADDRRQPPTVSDDRPIHYLCTCICLLRCAIQYNHE